MRAASRTGPPIAAPRWLALILLLGGGFLPPVDFFIVNVSLPSIHDDLHATSGDIQLVVSAYASGYAALLITGGRLGDLFGRRRLFLLGLVFFTLANAACGLAPSPILLVSGRLVQGLAAAVLVPQVLASIRALHEDERELARALGFYGVMMGLAAAAGQFLGGALVWWNLLDLGWRLIFLAKIPIALSLLLAAWLVVPETAVRRAVPLDLGGAALVSVALGCIVVPLSEGHSLGWPAWLFVPLAAAPALIAWFLWHEDRLAAHGGMPLLDLSLFRIASFRRGVVIATLFFFTTSFYLLFSIYGQEGRGLDPLETSLAIVPYGIGLFLGPFAGTLMQRFQAWLLAGGMCVQVAGYAAIALTVAFGLAGWPTTIAVFVAGFGQGVAFPRLYTMALGNVPPHQAGLASGILNSALQVGGALSVAAIGSLFFSLLGPTGDERAYAYAFSIAQATLTSGLFVAMLLAVPWRQRRIALDRVTAS